GLDLLISAYVRGDKNYRTRVVHLLTGALKHQINKANWAIATLDKISEHSTKAKLTALDAANDIADAAPFQTIRWRSRVQKLVASCSNVAETEEVRLECIKVTRSAVAKMRGHWISALEDVLKG